MTSSIENTVHAALAEALLARFFVRTDAFAVQSPDGSTYKTVKKPISKRRLMKMLSSGESLLAYQFSNGAAQWVCLDFDVQKSSLDTSSREDRLKLIAKIAENVRLVSGHLGELNIDHLVEFSGNRGFHIWIFFSHKVNRQDCYALLIAILAATGLSIRMDTLAIDLFPIGRSSSAKFGKGVKVPLSLHKKSNCYSYLVSEIGSLTVAEDVWRRELTPDFLSQQLELIIQCKPQDFSRISAVLESSPQAAMTERSAEPKFIRQSPRLASEDVDFELIAVKLSQCNIVRDLFERARSQEKLSERERLPIVGLLNRLRTPNRPYLGVEFAMQLFASLPGYSPEKTRTKLSGLKLYPPTCSHLKDLFPAVDCPCDGSIRSPLEFLGPLVEDLKQGAESFDISIDEALGVVAAELNYTRINDEVALVTILKDLEVIEGPTAWAICNYRTTESWPPVESYRFERIEEDGKKRTLFSLSARDRVWSTAAILVLHRVFALDFSEQSYGYRVEPLFQGGRIFKPWLNQWKLFTGRLSGYIYRREYEDCWLVKIDIRSFYSSIDMSRLEVALVHGPTENIKDVLNSMPREDLSRYRSICGELLKLCQMLVSSSGVPQGPAFARYLAEVFLMKFDRQMETLTEEGVICYSRYVDDIFLVVDSDADYREVEKIAVSALNRMGLEANEAKHYSGPVVEYRSQFSKYRNDTKYLVDQVSRRFESSSEEEIRDAADRLKLLVEGEFGEGIHNEHLNFLYTHLNEDPDTKALKQKYERHILEMKEGRGSLFSNFFSFFLKDPGRLNEQLEQFVRLDGLRRQAFVNALTSRIVSGVLGPELYSTVNVIFSHYIQASEISYLEIELMTCASLSQIDVCPEGLFERVSTDQTLRCLQYPFKKALPANIFEGLKRDLLVQPMAAFVCLLFGVIFANEMERASLTKLISLFRSRVLAQIQDVRPDREKLGFLDSTNLRAEDVWVKYYQIVCIASCGLPDLNQAEHEAIWQSMVSSYNRLASFDPGRPIWLSRINEDVISLANLNTGIVVKVNDGFYPGTKDNHQLFGTYHEYLTLFALLPASAADTLDPAEPREIHIRELREKLRNEKTPFIRWVLDEPPAQCYPNRAECLENILQNDLMMLYRSGKILIRFRSTMMQHSLFSARPVEVFGEAIMGSRYSSVLLDGNADGYESISNKLDSCDTLLEKINCAIKIYRCAIAFANSLNDFGRVSNVFADRSRMDFGSGEMLVPHTILGEALVWSDKAGARIWPNSQLGLIKGCSDWIRRCSLTMLSVRHQCNLSGKDVLDFASSVFDDEREQWGVILALSEHLSQVPNLSPFDIEYSKAAAILNVLRRRLAQGARLSAAPITLSQAFFQHYLRSRRKRELFLLFDVSVSVSKNTLDAFYFSLSASIEKFIECFDYRFEAFDLDAMIRREAEAVLEAARSKTGGDLAGSVHLSQFALSALEIDRETGDVKIDDELVFSRADVVDKSSEYYVMVATSGEYSFKPLTEYLGSQILGPRPLIYRRDSQGQKLLVVMGGALAAAFDRVKERREHWERLVRLQSEQTVRSFYINDRKIELAMRGMQSFSRAAGVVSEQRVVGIREAEDHLLRWISRFPVEFHETLLQVVEAHDVVSRDDASRFVTDLEERIDPGTVFFSIKRFDDISGTHRLILGNGNGPHIVRRLELDKVVSKIASLADSALESKLVIFSDIGISGGQICKALAGHYFASESDGALVDRERLHPISDSDRGRFLAGIRNVGKIEFLFALYTDQSRDRIIRQFADVGVSVDRIRFVGRLISAGRVFLDGNPSLSVRVQQRFVDLISDMPLVRRIFLIPDDESDKFYRSSVSSSTVKRTNLVARQRSVTKLGAKVFVLLPRDENGSPLFERIGEHNRMGVTVRPTAS